MDDAELSKAISHALRHVPASYGLALDTDGWVGVDDLAGALAIARPEWRTLGAEDIAALVARAPKRRHEIKDSRIRALYGHSTPTRLPRESKEPPELLYHGTSAEAAERIRSEGLDPMGRQHVHLSLTDDVARQVGLRKSRSPVVLTVEARKAHLSGSLFYPGGESVWLADSVPARFIRPPGVKRD
jgi:putative RNA 2'-phosphotransferase